MKRSSTKDPHSPKLPSILQRDCDMSVDPSAQSSLRYESKGCLLIIGDSDRASGVADNLVNHLHIVVLTDHKVVQTTAADGVAYVCGELIELSGYLGSFVAKIKGQDRALNLALLCPVEKDRFDLVLDLSDPPVFSMEIPPLGYYGPRADAAALSEAVSELSALTGVFHKPRFFSFAPSLCTHGRYGVNGCNRCTKVCPAKAVEDDGDKIQIDPYLCQGCGTCMLVCPTGAVSPNPDLERDHLDYISRALRSCPVPSETRVIIYDARIAQTRIEELGLGGQVILVKLRELAIQGMETWLTALANGAGEVVLLSAEHVTQLTLAALQQQLAYTQNVLGGMGYDPDRVRLLRLHEGQDLKERPSNVIDSRTHVAVSFNRLIGKRRNIEKALNHLASSAPKPCVDDVRLGAQAPFGGLTIDQQRCTLCMGCVKPCPTNALRRADDPSGPRLGFVEDLCVQCGICVSACPEQAIELLPRLRLDQQKRSEAQILRESPPFHCISCGKPFTTKSIVELMSERLKDNPFFQGEEINKLKQCPDCRAHFNVVDQLQRNRGVTGE